MQVIAPSTFRTLGIVLTVAVCTAAVSGQARLSRQDATRFEAKLAQIERNAARPRRGPISTQVTDGEINSYLRYLAGSQVPVGIVEPTLIADGAGRVSGRAIVDLDAVRTQKKRGWSDPLGYLTGRLPLTASGTLRTANGVGTFVLTSAELSGVTIPKTVLQELLSYYSRSDANPSGIDMDAPFQLPAAIREIRVGSGSAVIVQ
jgi:hypothetical protein